MPEDTLPDRPGLKQQTALCGELRLLRSLVPLTNPFAIDSGYPSSTADTLGISPLQSLVRLRLEASTRPSHEGLNTHLRPPD
jgi:hypothetical protein